MSILMTIIVPPGVVRARVLAAFEAEAYIINKKGFFLCFIECDRATKLDFQLVLGLETLNKMVNKIRFLHGQELEAEATEVSSILADRGLLG